MTMRRTAFFPEIMFEENRTSREAVLHGMPFSVAAQEGCAAGRPGDYFLLLLRKLAMASFWSGLEKQRPKA